MRKREIDESKMKEKYCREKGIQKERGRGGVDGWLKRVSLW